MSILTLETKKYSIKIDNFEGPLDLLCYLIDKNKMNIYSFRLMLKVLNLINDKSFEKLVKNETNDDIWKIFERMRNNPNYTKLNDTK